MEQSNKIILKPAKHVQAMQEGEYLITGLRIILQNE